MSNTNTSETDQQTDDATSIVARDQTNVQGGQRIFHGDQNNYNGNVTMYFHGGLKDHGLNPLHMESIHQISDEDITDIISLLGRDDLHKLFYALELPSTDIDKAEIKAGTLDVDLKARKVFETWRQRNGQQATQERILCALEECGNNDAKEKLEDKWKLKGKNKNETDIAQQGQDIMLASTSTDQDMSTNREKTTDGSQRRTRHDHKRVCLIHCKYIVCSQQLVIDLVQNL
ncbi:uncharacterized protein [Amphiura filiformis]|uniref:uncharacterized protein n=1 Tax=Amphiura filiformis TaxID=82378 RepID=UPI003B21BE1E